MFLKEKSDNTMMSVDSCHDNTELFNSLKEAAIKLNSKAGCKKLLAIIKTRMLVKDKDVIREDPGGLISSGNVTVEYKDGNTYLLVPTMLDSGSTLTLASMELSPYITATPVTGNTARVLGLGGHETGTGGCNIISLVSDDGKKEKVKATEVTNIATSMTMREDIKRAVAADCDAVDGREKLIN